MLDNLIDNAIRYPRQGAEVRVGAECRDGDGVLEVADTGPGIPPEDRPRVFERFYRGANGRQAGRARVSGSPSWRRSSALGRRGQARGRAHGNPARSGVPAPTCRILTLGWPGAGKTVGRLDRVQRIGLIALVLAGLAFPCRAGPRRLRRVRKLARSTRRDLAHADRRDRSTERPSRDDLHVGRRNHDGRDHDRRETTTDETTTEETTTDETTTTDEARSPAGDGVVVAAAAARATIEHGCPKATASIAPHAASRVSSGSASRSRHPTRAPRR